MLLAKENKNRPCLLLPLQAAAAQTAYRIGRRKALLRRCKRRKKGSRKRGKTKPGLAGRGMHRFFERVLRLMKSVRYSRLYRYRRAGERDAGKALQEETYAIEFAHVFGWQTGKKKCVGSVFSELKLRQRRAEKSCAAHVERHLALQSGVAVGG